MCFLFFLFFFFIRSLLFIEKRLFVLAGDLIAADPMLCVLMLLHVDETFKK
jgi:hypothetical protein